MPAANSRTKTSAPGILRPTAGAPPRADGTRRRPLRAPSAGSCLRLPGGQSQAEGRTALLVAFDGQAAVVGLRDRARNGETHPHARGLGRVERLEHPARELRRDPDPAVLYAQLDFTISGRVGPH